MTPAEPGASRRLLALLVGLAAAVAVVDQVTKQIALATLDEGVRVPVLGDLLGWQLWFNPGAAFSIGTGTTWLFTIIMVVVIVVILRYARRLRSVPWTVALGLLLGGAVGNLIDRTFRDPSPFQGHVVDFIAYYDWFIGNVADIGIVVAALVICVLALTGREIDGTRLGDSREKDGTTAEAKADGGSAPDGEGDAGQQVDGEGDAGQQVDGDGPQGSGGATGGDASGTRPVRVGASTPAVAGSATGASTSGARESTGSGATASRTAPGSAVTDGSAPGTSTTAGAAPATTTRAADHGTRADGRRTGQHPADVRGSDPVDP
ncbi:MAG: signal peptidase II, partial [Actinomycetaceae bacterium]